MKVNFELDSRKATIGVKVSEGANQTSFDVAPDAFNALFAGNYSTGYFFVSDDGPIYIEERAGEKVVVVQRAARMKQKISWNGDNVELNTPWTYTVTRLVPSSRGMNRSFEKLFVSTGPATGGRTPIYNAKFLGNMHDDGRICWGSAQLTANNELSLGTLVNLVSDFYMQSSFNADLERSTARWKAFSETQRLPGERVGTLEDIVQQAWGRR